MNKKSILLSLLFISLLAVGCGGEKKKDSNSHNNALSSGIADSSTGVVSSSNSSKVDIQTSSSSSDDYVTPVFNSYSYESLATSDEREFLSFANEEWRFKKGAVNGGEKSTLNDATWEKVTIPHTWNKTDGQDGGGNYYRGESWYHHRFVLGNDFLKNKEQYLEFLGVNMQAKVYVNDKLVGAHKGGYTGFRFNISKFLKQGENFLAVWVSNIKTQDIAPLGADFNFYGGIYREVNLFSIPKTHVDMNDYGSSGLKLTTTDVSKESAKLNIKAKIVNEDKVLEKVFDFGHITGM